MRGSILSSLVLSAFLLTLVGSAGCPFVRDNDTDGGSTTDGGGDGGGGTIEGPSAPGSCDDGLDNDGDTFFDCDDIGCADDTACTAPPTLTIYDVRDPSSNFYPGIGDPVAVDGVIVTAVDARTRSGVTFYDVWVQEKAGGPFSGVMLFGLDTPLARGDEVNFRGTMDVYFDLTEITDCTATVVASGQPIPAPEVLDASVLATASAESEQWESVLVEVRGVSVTETPVLGTDGNDHGDFRVTGDLLVGNLFYHDYTGMRTQGDSFQSLVGIMNFSYDERRLQPRDNDDITFTDGTHPGPVTLTIYDIQNPNSANYPGDGAAVGLSGVVVSGKSAPDANGRVNFVVQEVAGGPNSGIYVYNRANADMSAIAVGDLVDLSGNYTEFAFNGDTDTVSEITLNTITKTGTGTAPTPEVLTAAELANAATAERWEGVLVEIGATTCTVASNQYGEFQVTGGLKVDDMFMGSDLGPHSVGDTFDRLAGFLHYAFGYALVPRDANDITIGTVVGPTVLPITSIQDTTAVDFPGENAYVRVVDAVVTAVVPRNSGGVYGFYIQQGTGAYTGIYVYVPAAQDPGSLNVGDQVTVEGTYTEYNGMSELTVSSLTVTGTAAVPAPEAITDPGTFLGNTGEPWEGVLVTVDKGASKMVVDAAPDTYNEWTVDSGVMAVDDSMYFYQATAGEQIQTITGVVDWAFSHYRIQPRQASDITP
ncbi:MAG: hypothetical protein P1V51_25130 [Deltaproteobacteria bacterium]|nr:hypothetical protein [Deltaproteobacteria bacterium]